MLLLYYNFIYSDSVQIILIILKVIYNINKIKKDKKLLTYIKNCDIINTVD